MRNIVWFRFYFVLMLFRMCYCPGQEIETLAESRGGFNPPPMVRRVFFLRADADGRTDGNFCGRRRRGRGPVRQDDPWAIQIEYVIVQGIMI